MLSEAMPTAGCAYAVCARCRRGVIGAAQRAIAQTKKPCEKSQQPTTVQKQLYSDFN
ncbi:hypothetical protein GNE10_03280 [Nostoc sp. 2RC]|nr:hypothetical protein [Nostoc sp. 2RC]